MPIPLAQGLTSQAQWQGGGPSEGFLGGAGPALLHGQLSAHRDTLSAAPFHLHPQDVQTQRPIMKMKNPCLGLK